MKDFTVGAMVKQLKKKDPNSWRSRAWRRRDQKKRLNNIFMKFSELENCKFEPETGTLKENPSNPDEAPVPGDYFKRMGTNFQNSNPGLYKQGKLKKAKIYLKADDKDEAFKCLAEAFDLHKIF
mmetsp:Transcript_33677/g.52022  ORF Transcript_33677/g.52022 Transcript_33677/m.52022 type:complete len:124 (-) Transcript_33677:2378-2749(-)